MAAPRFFDCPAVATKPTLRQIVTLRLVPQFLNSLYVNPIHWRSEFGGCEDDAILGGLVAIVEEKVLRLSWQFFDFIRTVSVNSHK